jgi:hypothetical protein
MSTTLAPLRPHLSDPDIDALVAFLKTLTDKACSSGWR